MMSVAATARNLVLWARIPLLLLPRANCPGLLVGATLQTPPVGRPRWMVTSTSSQTKAARTAHKVLVGDINIHYERVGKGPHAILCLPGALGSAQTDFGRQLEGLNQENLTVIAWDPPGYGYSRPPDRDFSGEFFQRDADVAAGLMKTLGFDRYSLLGWSDGGITGIILAARYPNAVRRLVSWGANAYVTKEDIDSYERIRDIDKWSERMRAPMIALYGEEYFRRTWSDWVDAFEHIYKENGGNVCQDEASRVVCPTLIIHGAKDPLVGMEHPNYLHKNIKDSRLIVMPEGKHNLHISFAKDFNQAAEDFLAED